jgi:hypothetical protein
VIVVFGVFIGIQVSNWNDERQREQTAKVYIERIRQDLRVNLADLRERLACFSQVRTSALAALEAQLVLLQPEMLYRNSIRAQAIPVCLNDRTVGAAYLGQAASSTVCQGFRRMVRYRAANG